MKKKLWCSLVAFFALAMLLSVIPLSVSAEVTCTLGGEAYATLTASGGSVTLPEAPQNLKGTFVGWAVSEDGKEKLYPPSATVSVSKNATFTGVELSFVTRKGAEMRISEDDIALRFITDFTKIDYQRLRALVGDGGIAMGTIVSVKEYMFLTDYVFTPEALRAEDCTYLDIQASGFYTEEPTYYTLAGSIKNIREENRARTYLGRGYLRITYADGSVGTVLAPFDVNENVSTPYAAVLNAYEDRYYSYPHTVSANTVHGGKTSTSSPYTLSELDRMKAFLDTVGSVALTIDSEGEYAYVPTTARYYKSPWTVSYTYINAEDELFSVTLHAPEGKTLEGVTSILFVGSRIPLTAVGVTVTATTITATHSNYTPEY